MAKKSAAKAKRPDQFMLRLPDGMREKLAKLADGNGRSMNAEIIEAILRHLEGADRITRLWEFFERHRESIEGMPLVRAAVENLEIFAERSDDFRGGLRELRRRQERDARDAALPPIATDQVSTIRKLLKETNTDEAKFLAVMRAPRMEEIRDFERAISVIEVARRSREETSG